LNVFETLAGQPSKPRILTAQTSLNKLYRQPTRISVAVSVAAFPEFGFSWIFVGFGRFSSVPTSIKIGIRRQLLDNGIARRKT